MRPPEWNRCFSPSSLEEIHGAGCSPRIVTRFVVVPNPARGWHGVRTQLWTNNASSSKQTAGTSRSEAATQWAPSRTVTLQNAPSRTTRGGGSKEQAQPRADGATGAVAQARLPWFLVRHSMSQATVQHQSTASRLQTCARVADAPTRRSRSRSRSPSRSPSRSLTPPARPTSANAIRAAHSAHDKDPA